MSPVARSDAGQLLVSWTGRHYGALVLSLLALILPGSLRAHAGPADDVMEKKEPVLTLSGHVGEVFTVTYSPDGKRLASAGNREVKVWDTATGKEVFTYPIKGTNVYGLAFSPDGKRLAVGIGAKVQLLDVADGKEVCSLGGVPHVVFRLSFSPDGNHLAASSGSAKNIGDVRVWEVSTGKPVHALGGHAAAVLSVAYSADGRLLASAGGGTTAVRAGEVIVREADTGRDVLKLSGHRQNVYGIAFSPDGRRLASAGGGSRNSRDPGTVKLWELVSGQEVCQLDGHVGPVYSVVFSPDGRRLATAGADRTIRVWEVATAQMIAALPAHTGNVYSLVFSPDGRSLASAGGDSKVKVWDVAGVAHADIARGTPRTAQAMDELWRSLSGADAAKAYRSMGMLVSVRDQAIPLLRRRVLPVPPLSPQEEKRIARWIRELDSEEFEIREKANNELAKLGEAMVPALRKALTETESPELRRRGRTLIAALDERSLSPENLAGLRAVDVLEQIGSAEARSWLKELAAGLPESRLTREAHAALSRLARHPVAP